MINSNLIMKRIVHIHVLVLVVFALLMSSCQKQVVIIDEVQEDGLVYALVSQKGLSEYGDMLEIHRLADNQERKHVYTSDFLDLKPWKIEIADVDGDEEKDILIAVNKTTHFDDQAKNRMFIFNFDGDKLYKKWTGSQIAGVWNDFYVGNLLPIRGDELIFIEQVEDKGERLHIYYWFDFGFIPLATSDVYTDIIDFQITGDNRMQIVYKGKDREETLSLMVKDGEITEVHSEP